MTDVKTLIKEFQKNSTAAKAVVGVEKVMVERIPTGIFAFDLATGGGVPKGRLTIFYGAESSMKTSMALKVIAQAQRLEPEKSCVFIDVEGHFDPQWAEKMGVNLATLALVRPSNAEEVVNLVEGLIHADDLSVVVLDSLAAMITQKELDSSAEDAMVGVAGLIINKLYRKLGHALMAAENSQKTPALIFINQIRYKIGVLHGDPETLPGGPSLKFASSLTVRLHGKDVFQKDLSQKLPAFKELSAILKKWKVPVVARNSEFQVALLDNPDLNLKVGESYDLPVIMQYLKQYDLLVKDAVAGWKYVDGSSGEMLSFKTQDELKHMIHTDPQFAASVRQNVIRIVLSKGEVLGAT